MLILKKNNRLIATDLSKQIKLKEPQQINFIGKFENQKISETTFEFLQNSVNIF